MVFARPVTPNERLYVAGLRVASPFCIQLVIEGEGEVDVAELRAAVVLAAASSPGARLVLRGDLWTDAGEAPPVRVVPGGWNSTTFEDAAFARDVLDPVRGPTCEVVVALDPTPTIVVRAFHGVMDARGVLLFASDIFRAARGEPVLGAPSPLSDMDVLTDAGGAKTRGRTPLRQRSALGPTLKPAREYFWHRVTLPGAHPALVAKLAHAAASGPGDEGLLFMIPADVRRHVEGAASTANLSLPLLLDVAHGEPWEALQERLLGALGGNDEIAHDRLEPLYAHLPAPFVAGILRATVGFGRLRRAFAYSGLLSHLGRISLPSMSMPSFSATTVYSLPVHVPIAGVSIVATECGGRAEVLFAAGAGQEEREAVARLSSHLTEWLVRKEGPTWRANETLAPLPAGETVASLFLAAAARWSERAAVVHEGGAMSYATLDALSSDLAARLAAEGVARGSIVGILSRRTPLAVVAIMAALKLGAAYLPLDPDYPRDRIAYMLSDSRAAACVAASALARLAQAGWSGPVLALPDSPVPQCTAAVSHRPSVGAAPEDVAYVIYTSGSTGRPKGVAVTHRNLVNYLTWAAREYGVTEATRFALFTSLSFDLSVTSLLLPLVCGGGVVLFGRDLDHVVLREAVQSNGVTALKVTPSHLDLIGRLELASKTLSLVVVGGEQLRGSVALRAQRLFGPGCRIINEYGPTEATVGCATYTFSAEEDGAKAAVPVGIPCANTQIHLLDECRRRVEDGDVGELYISGEALANGYLHRPALTKQRFVRLPDGTRAYRTFDLGRLLPDGNLLYIGRADGQIKLRGLRIEPGEIESAIVEHPGIHTAFVTLVKSPTTSEDALVAYVVPKGGETGPFEEAALRAHLKRKLPAGWLPNFVVALSSLPLTVNGKVDSRALPPPFHAPAAADAAFVASREDGEPASALDTVIAEVWAAALKIDVRAVRPAVDFHALGGDSLQMLDLIARTCLRIVRAEDEATFLTNVRAVMPNPSFEQFRAAVVSSVSDTRGASGERG